MHLAIYLFFTVFQFHVCQLFKKYQTYWNADGSKWSSALGSFFHQFTAISSAVSCFLRVFLLLSYELWVLWQLTAVHWGCYIKVSHSEKTAQAWLFIIRKWCLAAKNINQIHAANKDQNLFNSVGVIQVWWNSCRLAYSSSVCLISILSESFLCLVEGPKQISMGTQ